jgi:hypothetical protein
VKKTKKSKKKAAEESDDEEEEAAARNYEDAYLNELEQETMVLKKFYLWNQCF